MKKFFPLLVVALLAAVRVSAQLPAARPNIVFLLSDDHSAPWLGCYGTPLHTPNLDRFAAAGMRFDRAFTTAPQCVPSRASLMTSRSPQAVRMGRFSSPLSREATIFPELLRSQGGYYTGVCRRSYHLDGEAEGRADRRGTVSGEIITRLNLRTMPERMDYVDISGPGETENRVSAFLGRVPAGRPFFLWVNFNDPHHPWTAPKVHDPAKLPLPPDWPDLPELRADLARHCDEIARVDDEVQLVLDLLEKHGHAKDTIVVFMGDNGMALPRGKGALYERGLHVPLLVRWPGVIQPGSSSDALISGEDLGPTLLAAAGLKPLPAMSGVSFLPALRGEPFKSRDFVFGMREPHGSVVYGPDTSASGYDLSRSVRDTRYKLILNYTPWMRYAPVDSAGDPGWRAVVAAHTAGKLAPEFERSFFTVPRPLVELYDLQTDPYERHNLAGRADAADAEKRLKLALQEKMIVDYDFLPLPLH